MNVIHKLRSLFKAKNIELTGSWNGFYGYSNHYPQSMRDNKVNFTATITDNPADKFSGTIEESEEGIPEISRIEGQIKGRKIQFTKKYEKLYLIEEDGNRVVQDGPQILLYDGLYDDSSKKFYGQWSIEIIYKLDNGQELPHISTGHWEMEKL